MTRTLPAAVATNIAKRITVPTWLLKVEYATPIMATSGNVITLGADTFTRQGLRVENMADRSLRVVLRDDDDAVKALVDAEGIDDIAVTLWSYYETDGVKVWTGFTDGIRFKNHEATLDATRIQAGWATFPKRFFHRGDFPYLPTEGTVIKWNGLEITLRSR